MSGDSVEVKILDQWDSLKEAIQRVECALPFQMTPAIEHLIAQKKAMENLLVRDVFRPLRRPSPTNQVKP